MRPCDSPGAHLRGGGGGGGSETGMDQMSIGNAVLTKNLRPKIDDAATPADITALIGVMLQNDPKKRPTMAQVVDRLTPRLPL